MFKCGAMVWYKEAWKEKKEKAVESGKEGREELESYLQSGKD